MDQNELVDLLLRWGVWVGAQKARRVALAAKLVRAGAEIEEADLQDLWDEAQRQGVRNPGAWIAGLLETGDWEAFLPALRDRLKRDADRRRMQADEPGAWIREQNRMRRRQVDVEQEAELLRWGRRDQLARLLGYWRDLRYTEDMDELAARAGWKDAESAEEDLAEAVLLEHGTTIEDFCRNRVTKKRRLRKLPQEGGSDARPVD